jgi:CBS domain-containing protein
LQTSAIRYRVVDFLKAYPPFQAMEEDDLMELVARGRVRFHEVDEYVYWQGKPPGDLFFVVQQGAVSLFEEGGEQERLRDVRGPGDLLGIDRFLGASAYRYSAKAASDVILYALASTDMEPLLTKYPSAGRYLAAHGSVSASYEAPDAKRRIERVFAHDPSRRRPLLTCLPSDSIGEAVRRMHEAGSAAIAVLSAGGALRAVLTTERVLAGLAAGEVAPELPVEALTLDAPGTVAPNTTVDQCLLAMVDRADGVVAITEGGAPAGHLHALVTAADLTPVFGEQPLTLLQEIEHAPSLAGLASLNQRARGFLLQQLTTPASVDWLSQLAHRFDARLFERVLGFLGLPGNSREAGREFCWFFYGASGRAESMTALVPQIGLVFGDGPGERGDSPSTWHRRVVEALQQCGYVGGRSPSPRETAFACAPLGEWQERFRGFVRDPVANAIYKGRPLFDLRAVAGDRGLVDRLQEVVRDEVVATLGFVPLLAHDCIANLPPLAFFRDLVVEDSGEKTAVLHLDKSALLPLVDVGRVFAIHAGRSFGDSTLKRFALARERLPTSELVFREAADSLRVMLYHKARAGIRHQDGGAELDPASLSHYDRQVLKSGFASILRLLELTAECGWLETG